MNLRSKSYITEKYKAFFLERIQSKKLYEFKINGWVKNTPDDKVEIFAQGNEENLNTFIDWCKQGPPKAIVENIHVAEKQTDNSLKEFSILYDD